MKDHDTNRHPGPWRVMSVDAETAGILVAVGFLAMGLVSIAAARWFVLACLALGATFAVLLRFTRKSLIRPIVGAIIVLIVVVLWWAGRLPQRPQTVSSGAIHVQPTDAPLMLRLTGYWLDCWFDKNANVDRCKLTDRRGSGVFEDVFLPCEGQSPLPQSELVFDARWTGSTWTRSDNGVYVPTIYLANGDILLPRSLYKQARQAVFCSAY
jgi:hypothetical protein